MKKLCVSLHTTVLHSLVWAGCTGVWDTPPLPSKPLEGEEEARERDRLEEYGAQSLTLLLILLLLLFHFNASSFSEICFQFHLVDKNWPNLADLPDSKDALGLY